MIVKGGLLWGTRRMEERESREGDGGEYYRSAFYIYV
jgi:hypothetical protein